MDLALKTDQCTGCCACADICPVGAITIETDESGCMRPQVSLSLCVSCGKCKKVCLQFEPSVEEWREPSVFIGYCDDSTMCQKSSSGGIFAALAKSILEKGGVVYGATVVYNSNRISCRHLRVDDLRNLPALQGSKYVQSDMSGVYIRIGEDLKAGRTVLFSGTSCQVAALKKVFGDQKNLYTVDLVCHGVPKSAIFYDYISFIEKKYNVTVEDISFRVKGFHSFWTDTSHVLRMTCRNRRGVRDLYLTRDESAFYKLFFSRAGYRESCYNCRYASLNKPADVTLGDFRPSSIERDHYSLDAAKTYSSIIIHNFKGRELLEIAGDNLRIVSASIHEMLAHHLNLRAPSSITASGEEMLSIYQQKGFAGLQRCIDRQLFRSRFKSLIKRIIKHRRD